MGLLKLLENPGREFTVIPFWFLNDALYHRLILRRENEIHMQACPGGVKPMASA